MDELAILNKHPKFNLCQKVSKAGFLTELERINTKHRYGSENEKKVSGENKLTEVLGANRNQTVKEVVQADVTDKEKVRNEKINKI